MSQRPNIVFLMTDHTNAAAVAAGSPCLTPHLQGLAGEGVRFGRCYTPNAICSPSRASLMTATYPSTHGVWDCTHTQRREWVDIRPARPHWAEHLQAAGYRTGYFGKWHVEQSNELERFGWAESDGRVSSRRVKVGPGRHVTVPKEGYRDYPLAATGEDDGSVLPHPAFERGIDFIRRHAAGEAPFCCFVSTAEPHDPYIPARRFLERYDLGRVPLSPTLRDDLAGKPEVVRRLHQVWEGLSDDDWRFARAAYWAVISSIDDEVGRLLAVLRETGVDGKTVVVFTSDHGDMLGGHGLITKGVGTAYEEVYNIPLIVRVPGLAAGCDDASTCTSLVDLGPTLLDVAGAEPLPGSQGRSLRPVLEGRADPAAWQDAYAEFFGQRFVYTQRLVWHGAWKYVFSPGGRDELYNLAEDPGELRNRAEDPACREVLRDLVARMWRKMREIGDESLFNTQYATLRTAPFGPGVAGPD